MHYRWLALVCGVAGAACAPAELAGSDRAEGGVADSQPPPDAPIESATGCRDATSAGDFYVAPATGADCNFSTISAALQAARSLAAGQPTIHLGAAVYSDPADFPIDLRGGISLAGSGDSGDASDAGEPVTTLQGRGLTRSVGVPFNAYHQLSNTGAVSAAILVGDPVKTSRISGVAITTAMGSAPVVQVPEGSEAIVCESGNAKTVPPDPNTLVSQVAISGFEVGVRVTWSESPMSGCNLSLTSSVVRDGWYGVVADGQELGPVPGQTGIAGQTVSAKIGDSRGGGNQFVNLDINNNQYLDLNGAGIATCGAVTGLVVVGNHFFEKPGGRGDWGIWAVPGIPSPLPGFDIEGNEFGPLKNGGIELAGPVIVERLIDNSFHDISMVNGHGWPGVGLAVGGELVQSTPLPFPVVRRARGNAFVGNDVGVVIRSWVPWTSALTHDGLSTDFGAAADPGNNTFRCNSTPPSLAGGNGPGADVFINFSTPPPSGSQIPFEGNVWDHAPPTPAVAPPGGAPQGTDLSFVGDDAGAPWDPMLDVADASADGPPCPAGRVAGP